jgi:hypothetical protein
MKTLKYQDGYYFYPVETERTIDTYPFYEYGDIEAVEYTKKFTQWVERFDPVIVGTEDPERAGCYIISESKPEQVAINLYSFSRTYASVPSQKVTYGVELLRIPAPPGEGEWRDFGDRLIHAKPNGKFDFYSWKDVTADSGAGTGLLVPSEPYSIRGIYAADAVIGVPGGNIRSVIEDAINAYPNKAGSWAPLGVDVEFDYSSNNPNMRNIYIKSVPFVITSPATSLEEPTLIRWKHAGSSVMGGVAPFWTGVGFSIRPVKMWMKTSVTGDTSTIRTAYSDSTVIGSGGFNSCTWTIGISWVSATSPTNLSIIWSVDNIPVTHGPAILPAAPTNTDIRNAVTSFGFASWFDSISVTGTGTEEDPRIITFEKSYGSGVGMPTDTFSIGTAAGLITINPAWSNEELVANAGDFLKGKIECWPKITGWERNDGVQRTVRVEFMDGITASDMLKLEYNGLTSGIPVVEKSVTYIDLEGGTSRLRIINDFSFVRDGLRHITVPSNAFSDTAPILLRNAAGGYMVHANPADYELAGDEITLQRVGGTLLDDPSLFQKAGQMTIADFMPSSRIVRAKFVTDYFPPSVLPETIPLGYTPVSDDDLFSEAVSSSGGWLPKDVSKIERYKGAIWQRTQSFIQL